MHTVAVTQTAEAPLPRDDGRQSPAAAAIQRGVQRLLRDHGFASVTELPLRNGRRADVAAVNNKHELLIVEIKSSLADFKSDAKWPDYDDYCDRLYFAVDCEFPADVIPNDIGLIIADRYGGEILRHPSGDRKLAAARRKAMVLTIAQTAAHRLLRLRDPGVAVVQEAFAR